MAQYNQGQYIRRDYHVNTGGYPNTGYYNNSQPQQNSIMIERHYIPIDLYREMYELPPQRTTHSVPPPGYPTVNRHNIWDTSYLFDLYSPFYDLGNLNTGGNTGNATNTSNTGNTTNASNSPNSNNTNTSSNSNNTNTSSNSTSNTGNIGNTNSTNSTTNTSSTPRATFIPTSSTNSSVNINNRNTTTTRNTNSYNDLLTNIFNRYIERTIGTNVTNNGNTSTSNNQSGNMTAQNGTTGNGTTGNTTPRPRGYVELQMFDNLSDTPTVISSNISNGTQGTQLMTSIINAFTTLNNRRNGGEGDNETQQGLTSQEIFDNTTLHIFNDDLSDEIDETEDPKCSICQEEFNDGQRLRRIEECEHYFHKSCIDTWFTTHNNCPMCRTSVVADLD